jgi:hypothetical protein
LGNNWASGGSRWNLRWHFINPLFNLKFFSGLKDLRRRPVPL